MIKEIKNIIASKKMLFTITFLLIAVVLSVYTHSMVFDQYYYPTYGNTNIHVASERELVESGYYPISNDFSYGGGIPNLYVPIYRFLASEIVFLSGEDFTLINRMLVMLFALLLPLGYYLLGRESFGEEAGLFAAVLVSLLPEMLIYTVRPLPQALGLALLPFAFYIVMRGKLIHALLASIAITWVHQEAGIFFVASVFSYACLSTILNSIEKKRIDVTPHARVAFIAWLAGTLAYFAWHYYAVGNLNILELAQFKYHEGGVVTAQFVIDKTGLTVLIFGVIGALAAASKKTEQKLFVFGVLLFSLFAIKNDLIGLQVFMDRFVVFLQIPLVLCAGFACAKIAEKISTLASVLTGRSKQQ